MSGVPANKEATTRGAKDGCDMQVGDDKTGNAAVAERRTWVGRDGGIQEAAQQHKESQGHMSGEGGGC